MNYHISAEMHDVLLQAVRYAIARKRDFKAGDENYEVTLQDALAMLEEPWI